MESYLNAYGDMGPHYDIPEQSLFYNRLGSILSTIQGIGLEPDELTVIIYRYRNECSGNYCYLFRTAGQGPGESIADITWSEIESGLEASHDLKDEQVYGQGGYPFTVREQGW